MIKGAGAGAALVWSAPAITSIGSSAFAQTRSPVGCDTRFTCGDTIPFCNDTKFCQQFDRLSCVCVGTPEGTVRCANTCVSCNSALTCSKSSDCASLGADAFCWATSCCGNICVVPCEKDFAAGTADAGGGDPLG